MDVAAAGGNADIAPGLADVNIAAAAHHRDHAANLVELDITAAGGGVDFARDVLGGHRAACGFQLDYRGLRGQLDLELDVAVIGPLADSPQQRDFSGTGGGEFQPAEFAARGFFGTGAHVFANRIGNIF